MRNLTIKRIKSFVGCLATMKVYIEDPTSDEIVINSTPCRKIGVLKNGEETTFVIGENAARVYVIADKLSRNYCNEYYDIPEGNEDIYLSGKNRYNPANGNAFRFEGVTDIGVLENRKAGTKKGLTVFIISIVVGLALGLVFSGFILGKTLFDMKTEPKVFSSNGMKITLTDRFIEASNDNCDVCYGSEDVSVFVIKESFSDWEGAENCTLDEYGDLVLYGNGFSSDVEIQKNDGLTYIVYSYTNPETDDTFCYYAFLYKSSDAFWMIQFCTYDEKVESYESSFFDWAKTVEFSK